MVHNPEERAGNRRSPAGPGDPVWTREDRAHEADRHKMPLAVFHGNETLRRSRNPFGPCHPVRARDDLAGNPHRHELAGRVGDSPQPTAHSRSPRRPVDPVRAREDCAGITSSHEDSIPIDEPGEPPGYSRCPFRPSGPVRACKNSAGMPCYDKHPGAVSNIRTSSCIPRVEILPCPVQAVSTRYDAVSISYPPEFPLEVGDTLHPLPMQESPRRPVDPVGAGHQDIAPSYHHEPSSAVGDLIEMGRIKMGRYPNIPLGPRDQIRAGEDYPRVPYSDV